MTSHETDLSLFINHCETKNVSFGEFELNIGPEMTIPERVKTAFEHFLNEDFISSHRAVSQPHQTTFQKHFGLPSPIVRIDASSIVDLHNPRDSIFEVEARPAGLGILTNILSVVKPVREVFTRVASLMGAPVACGVLPSVIGATGGRDRSIDTQLLAQSIGLSYLYRAW